MELFTSITKYFQFLDHEKGRDFVKRGAAERVEVDRLH